MFYYQLMCLINLEIDPKQESTNIIYLEKNNLHGNAMSNFLPTGAFKWREPKEFDLINIVMTFRKLIF